MSRSSDWREELKEEKKTHTGTRCPHPTRVCHPRNFTLRVAATRYKAYMTHLDDYTMKYLSTFVL